MNGKEKLLKLIDNIQRINVKHIPVIAKTRGMHDSIIQLEHHGIISEDQANELAEKIIDWLLENL